MKTFQWRSTYKESLGEALAHSTLTDKDKDIFSMLFHSYRIQTSLLPSSFFECLRVGDGKHMLIVRKDKDNSWCVKYSVNENYANKLERFTS